MRKNEVSIIIPAWKADKWINDCLQSVYDQSWFKDKNNKFEILVGIDNCEDTKLAICPKENTRVIYFKDNYGPYIVRNTLAYKFAKYDNLIFFDSDDLMHPDLIKDSFQMDKGFIVFQYMTNNKIGYSCGSSFVEKTLLIEYGGYANFRCAADSDFIRRVEQGNHRCIKLTGKNYMYRRMHPNQLTCCKDTGFRSELRTKYRKITNNKLKNNNLINIPQYGEYEEIIFEDNLVDDFDCFLPNKEYIKLINRIKKDRINKFIIDDYIICSFSTIKNIEKINLLKHRLDLLGCKYDIKCVANNTDIDKIRPKIISDILLVYHTPILYIDIDFLFLKQPIFEMSINDFDIGIIEGECIKLFNTTENSIRYLNDWDKKTKMINLKNVSNI